MHEDSFDLVDIEWKVVYVGSAEDESYDQELDDVLLPADKLGRFAFILKSEAPNPAKVPTQDILGATIVLLTCTYKNKEFLRVGYYVNNEYVDPPLTENPPAKPDISQIRRTVADKEPRVTKFPHRFDFTPSGAGSFPHPELLEDESKDGKQDEANGDFTPEIP